MKLDKSDKTSPIFIQSLSKFYKNIKVDGSNSLFMSQSDTKLAYSAFTKATMSSVFPRLSMVSAHTDKLNKQVYTEDKLCQSRGPGRLTDEAFKHIKHVRGRFVRSRQRWLRIRSLSRSSIWARARTLICHTSLKMTVNTPESEINSLLCQCHDCRH